MQPQRAQQVSLITQAIRLSPEYFVGQVIGEELEDYQARILNSVRDNPVTTVRSCHGIGKSFTAARAALWFMQSFEDAIVITTAPTFRQVEQIIWREMRGAYKLSKTKLGGRMYKTPRYEKGENWYAIGVSSDDSDRIQGFHAKSGHILIIGDEAAGLSEDTYVAIDSIASSLDARVLLIGNPTNLVGGFHKSHTTWPHTNKIHVGCFDTPNFIENGVENLQDLQEIDDDVIETVKPHLISVQWAKDKLRKWGINNPVFQARVLGEFPSAESNTLIPLHHLEAATSPERHAKLKKLGLDKGFVLGSDVARYGDDDSVITPRHGGIVDPQIIYSHESTTSTTGRLKGFPERPIFTIVDEDGLGGGVVDQLLDDKVEGVIGIQNNSSPWPDDTGLTFVNLRSQIYWHLRELFEKGLIALPTDTYQHEDILAELSGMHYFVTRRGIMVESKDDLKKVLKHSPDRGDSLAYSFADWADVENDLVPTTGKTFDQIYNERNQR